MDNAKQLLCLPLIITFRVSHKRRELYIRRSRLLVCPRRMPTLLQGPGCNLEMVGVPLVVLYWVELQSVL